MARRRTPAISIPAPYEEPTYRKPDHLSGHHYEDFLSPGARGSNANPPTPLSATVEQPDADCEERHWMRRWSTPDGILRREQARESDPGGKTFLKGDIFGE